MRAVLAFTSYANPTYVPLGIASLSAYIKASSNYFADQYIDAVDMKSLADEIVNNGLDIFYHIIGRPSIFDDICCEHYLLYMAHLKGNNPNRIPFNKYKSPVLSAG